MAAIIQPHPISVGVRPRPLRLVPATRPGSPQVAITLHRRSLIATAALVLVLLAAMAGAVAAGRGAFASLVPPPPSAAAGPKGATVPGSVTMAQAGGAVARVTTIVVRPGDTLWAIARRLQPTGDVRPLVDRLSAAHGAASLQPGERLILEA